MVNQHVAYYLVSKIIAAALNLGTMVIFVRVGGAETYGFYVVALAWGYIIYSFTLQWLRFAFFANFEEGQGAAFIGTYLRMLVGGLGLIAGLAVAGVLAKTLGFERTVSVVVLVAGLAIYDALHEMGRTRLEARAVAAGVLARATLMLVLGTLSLVMFGTGIALAIAVGLAHIFAVVPLAINLGSLLHGRWSSTAAGTLVGYGKGIFPAYALDGVGLQLDRLLLARTGTLAEVGSYGAVADLIRQIMVVISEAIAGAYIAIARSELRKGNEEEAVKVLGQAFLAFTALATFGGATILRFDAQVLSILFGPEIAHAVDPTMPLIVASSMLLIFRSYYFGQVLYLTENASMLVRSNGVHCFLMAVLGLVLTPMYGMFGAALALTTAHFGGCLVYVHAWRNTFAMRLPYRNAFVIVVLALAAFMLTGVVQGAVGTGIAGLSLNAAILTGAAMIAACLYNILSFNNVVTSICKAARLRLTRPAA